MLKSEILINLLSKHKFDFITGIPCSILKDFLWYLKNNGNGNKIRHIISVNEAEAIGVASGYYLSTSKIPIVYMQNSGLANSVDILTSLTNKEVYKIPILFLISWRGEPGQKDAAQHLKMGGITLELLEILGIRYSVLSGSSEEIEQKIIEAKQYLESKKLPYALIIRKKFIDSVAHVARQENHGSFTREMAIKIIVDAFTGDEAVISATGKVSRELFEYREAKKQAHKNDFYILGAMGSAMAVALGVALAKPKKKVFVFDGDGSILMQMGTLAAIGHYFPSNFFHIIFDNNAYESTGGQKTISNSIDFCKVSLACGYKDAKIVLTQQELGNAMLETKQKQGPIMLVVRIEKGSRKDLSRPSITPIENKNNFMEYLKKN